MHANSSRAVARHTRHQHAGNGSFAQSSTLPAALVGTLAFTLAAMLPSSAHAQSAGVDNTGAAQAVTDADQATPALWTAGLFAVAGSHPAYPGSDHRVQSARLLPFVTYRGPLLRIEGGSAGLRAIRTPRYEFDFSAAGSFGSGGSDVKAREGMPSIGTLVEIGPSLRINIGEPVAGETRTRWRASFPVRAVFDASRDFDYAGIAFEPKISYSQPLTQDWQLTTYAALLFGNRGLTSLFYEVAPQYATTTRPAFNASAGFISSSLGASVSRAIGQDFRVGLFAGVESVSGASNEDSPLVRRKFDGRVGATLTWTAFRSGSLGVE